LGVDLYFQSLDLDTGGKMTECIFCKIVKGEAPASVVYEDESTMAFMDLGQVNPGHVIVIVKQHIQDIYALDKTLAGAVFSTAVLVAKVVKKAMRTDGITLLQANEQAGWQTVYHFHFHVLPRHTDDELMLTWPAKNPPKEELDRLATHLRAAFEVSESL
jgi:histidine triad (HIT) family protein